MYVSLSQNRPSRFCHNLKQLVWNLWNSTLMINLGEWFRVWKTSLTEIAIEYLLSK